MVACLHMDGWSETFWCCEVFNM